MALDRWLTLIDPASFLIIFSALFIIYYGSYRSFIFHNENFQIFKDNNQVPSILYILFPIVGSIMLISLFYFLNIMYYLLIFIISFSSLVSLTYVLNSPFQTIFKKFSIPDYSKKIKLSDDEDFTVTTSMGVAFIATLCLCIGWFFSNHYLFVNILSIGTSIAALSFIRLNNLKALTIFLWCFLLYDVFWVFISKYIFGTSVMESVAVQVMDKFYLPMLITFPKFFGKGGGSSLGNGDYVLPGIFICQLYFLDKYYHFSERESASPFSLKNLGYFKISLLSYTVGLIFSLVMVIATERGQPALLYLVPMITIPTIVVAYKRDQLALIMKPVPKPKQENDSMESLIISNINDDDGDDHDGNIMSMNIMNSSSGSNSNSNNNNSILINSISKNNNNDHDDDLFT
ncbi:hypothetical protein CYY_002282 [Polysphondylium violaceum]|uniref:Peptidase A22B family protein n=1 Tax=Polysphondylium violaceum TaxID=133409 RepID=A0A8J4V0Y1_9MYCE|nr:hypothetical protein CYY_002282 [Polysphondylium violaceum]